MKPRLIPFYLPVCRTCGKKDSIVKYRHARVCEKCREKSRKRIIKLNRARKTHRMIHLEINKMREKIIGEQAWTKEDLL